MAKRETLFKIDQQAGGGVGGSIFMGGTGGTPGAHNLADTSIHLGPLLRSQAPWVADDIAAHAALPDVHHPRATGGAGISVNVPTQEVSISLASPSSGLTFNANNQLLLGTPGTISALTVNNLDGTSHNHAVLAHSDGAANPNHLAKYHSDGGMAFARVTTPLINTTTGNLLIDPAGDVLFPQAQTVRSQNFTPGFPIQGWWIGQYDGGLGPSVTRNAVQIYSMTVDELRARAFVVDEVRVDRGEEFISKSYGIVARGFTTPSTVGGTVTVYFEDSPAYIGAIFSAGDHLLFRIIDDSGGGLTIANIEFTVSNYNDEGNNEQSWTLTLIEGLTDFEIRKGITAWDMGQSGQGYIHSSVVDTSGAPYMDIRTWHGTGSFLEANSTPHLRVGRLISALDNDLSPSGWGLFSTNAFLKGDVIAANGNIAALSNIGLNIKASTNETQWEDWPLHLTFSTDPIRPSLNNTVFQIWGERWGGNNQGYIQTVSGTGTGVENAHIQIGTRRLTGLPDVNGATITFVTTNSISDVTISVRNPTSPPTKGSFTIDANTTVNGHIVPTVGDFYDLGSPGAPFNTLYVGNIVAQTIAGESMSGAIWQYNDGNMTIRSDSSSARTLFVANAGAGTMHLDVEGNIIVGGAVDGVDVAGFKSNYDAHIANPNAHHLQAHVLATASALGPDHTVSGLSAGQVLRATGSTTARFMSLNHSDLAGVTADQHHAQVHIFATDTGLGPDHTISGATAGHVFRATGATTGRIMQLSHNDLGGIGPNQHHNQVHSITGSDHTVTGSQLQVVGLTATNTLGLLTPSSNPGAAAALLRTGTSGDLTLKTLIVQGNVDVTSGGDLTVGANVLFVDVSQGNVGINRAPDPQFDLDVAGALRATYLIGKHAIQLSGARVICHFDGQEPFETNFTGELTGHTGQVATTSGAVIFRPGRFGKAVQVARATTNLIQNPSFETGTSGWSNAGGGGSMSIGAERSYVGSQSAKISTTGAGNGQFRSNAAWISLANGETLTVQCRAWAEVTGASRILIFDNTNSATRASTTGTLADDWELLTTTWTNNTGGTVAINVYIYNLNGGGTSNVWYDAIQAEKSEFPTAYCDGSLGAGHSWSGTAHASASSRTQATLRYGSENVSPVQGTVMFWIKTPSIPSGATMGNTPRLFEYGQWSNPVSDTWISITTNNTHTSLVFAYHNGSVSRNVVSSITPLTDAGWHHIVMTWRQGELAAYVDGVSVGSDTLEITTTVATAQYIGLGNNRLGTENYPSALFDEFAIINHAITADEIRAIYESNAPVFAESSTFQFRVGNGLVWGDNEGLFARDEDGTAVFAVVGVDGKSWGGVTLDKGDVMIGNSTAGYLQFDRSAQSVSLVNTNLALFDGAVKFVETNPVDGIGIQTYTTQDINTNFTRAIAWWSNLNSKSGLPDVRLYGLRFNNDVTAGFQAFGDNVGGRQASVLIYAASRDLSESASLLLNESYGSDSNAQLSADLVQLSAGSASLSVSTGVNGTHIAQTSTTAARPALSLSQADLSEEFIRFNGTVSAGNPINTTALGSYYGRVRVSVNGAFRWLALYN